MKKLLFAAACTAVLSSPVLACTAPGKAPEIPDPATAVTAQMVKSNNEVKEYVRAQEEYIACSGLGSREKRQALESLQEYADRFNQAVRAFKLASN
ncbi:hypothetical protein [Marinimicrobium sp. ARAG 43.8]|uniref:hypothetical protein n=1 Tax=Marinimicrobium sp. ARAG 43.8 TaxID=3418719 RepID=UPI003CF311CC